jgi:DNA-binding NtrC family response regulator
MSSETGFKRVLIVDDDEMILDAFECLFDANDWKDFHFDLCETVEDAIMKIMNGDVYDLVVVDLRMGGPDPSNLGCSGPYVLQAFLKTARKDAVAAVISSELDEFLIRKNVDGQILMFSKPFDVQFLWAKAEDARKDLKMGHSPKQSMFYM